LNFNIDVSYNKFEYKENPRGIGLDDYFTKNEGNFDINDVNGNCLYNCTGIDYLVHPNNNFLLGDDVYDWLLVTSMGTYRDVAGSACVFKKSSYRYASIIQGESTEYFFIFKL